MKKLKIAHIFSFFFFSIGFFLCFSFASAKEIAFGLLPGDFENEEAAVVDWVGRASPKFESMLSYLSSLEGTVSNFTYLTKNEKDLFLSDLSSYKMEISQSKEEMLDLTSISELESLGDEVETHWSGVRIDSFKMHGELLLSRLDYTIESLESLTNSLEIKSNGLNSEEKAAVAIYLQSIRGEISDMKGKRTLVSGKLLEITEEDSASIYFSQGKQYVREAKEIALSVVSDIDKILFYME